MQNNVIDQNPYFLEANKKQALGERRIGLGVMGLHDMMLYAGVKYGSEASIDMIIKSLKSLQQQPTKHRLTLLKKKVPSHS